MPGLRPRGLQKPVILDNSLPADPISRLQGWERLRRVLVLKEVAIGSDAINQLLYSVHLSASTPIQKKLIDFI